MEPKTELQRIAIANTLKKERELYQRAIDIQWFNNRIESGKMSRCLALINKEAEMEKDFKEKKNQTSIGNTRTEKEISLAYEISQQAREDACQLLRRHCLRETDPQLRELTRKLQAAYVRKDLEQQILHNEYRRLQDKIETANANKIVEDAIHDGRKANERDREKFEKRLQYCAELKKQITNDQNMRLHAQKSELALQRKQIADIVKTVDEDRKRHLHEKQQSVARMRQEMLEAEAARRALRRREAEAQEADSRRVAREQAAVTDRTSTALQERLDRQRTREEMNKKIGEQIAAAEASRVEREELIRQLQHQEYIERGLQQDLAERRGRAVGGADVRAALDTQTAARVLAARQLEEADRARRKHMEAKIAAEEEEERGNMRLKRERARQYALELRQQIEEDGRRRRERAASEERRAAAERAQQSSWDAEARAEGEIILKEHGRILTKD